MVYTSGNISDGSIFSTLVGGSAYASLARRESIHLLYDAGGHKAMDMYGIDAVDYGSKKVMMWEYSSLLRCF